MAEQGYTEAAALARHAVDTTLLAFAPRHVSDVARESDHEESALAKGKEAVAINRSMANRSSLDLANALRVTALALQKLKRSEEALPLWREAQELYAAADVTAGVDECEFYLSD